MYVSCDGLPTYPGEFLVIAIYVLEMDTSRLLGYKVGKMMDGRLAHADTKG